MPAQGYTFALINQANAATQTAIRTEATSLAVAFTSAINVYSDPAPGPINVRL
jgi:hypothetical protein